MTDFLKPCVISEEHSHESHSFVFQDAERRIVGPTLETQQHYLVEFVEPREYISGSLTVYVTTAEGQFAGLHPDSGALAFTDATVKYTMDTSKELHVAYEAYFTFSLTPKDSISPSAHHKK